MKENVKLVKIKEIENPCFPNNIMEGEGFHGYIKCLQKLTKKAPML